MPAFFLLKKKKNLNLLCDTNMYVSHDLFTLKVKDLISSCTMLLPVP